MVKWIMFALMCGVCASIAHAETYSTDTYTVEYDARTSTGNITFKDLDDQEALTISWDEKDLKYAHLDVSIHPGVLQLKNNTPYTAVLYPSTRVPMLVFDSLRKNNKGILTSRYLGPYIQLNRIAYWCKHQETDNMVFLYVNDIHISTIPIKNVWHIGDMILDYIAEFKGEHYGK